MFESLFAGYAHLGYDELSSDSVVQLFDPPRQRVEIPAAANAVAWADYMKSVGAKTPREKRRAEHALCDTLSRITLDDRSIVRILNRLASRAPSSAIRDDTLKQTILIEAYFQAHPKERVVPSDLLLPLMELKVDPRDYSNVEDRNRYFWDNQLVKLLSKYPFKGYEIESEMNAVALFLSCEQQNAATNARWKQQGFDPRIEAVAKRLDAILGIPPSDVEVMHSGGWGPGVVEGYNFSTEQTGPEFKFAARPTLTPLLIPIATRIRETVPAWDASLRGIYGRHEWSEVVGGSTLFTVPKKFKMNRCALKEPMLNAWMQSGLGTIMRKRFAQATGVDLRWSWTVNQEMARIGSLTGVYCTVDLRSASDSVCRGPLKSIASAEWFGWWSTLASETCELPFGTAIWEGWHPPLKSPRHRFQMMSSMGNGFTFELESILFYAIITSVVPGVWTPDVKGGGKHILTWPNVSVFGDDLVFPTAYYGKVVEMLTMFGFTVNMDKSFNSGLFRESCGKDFFHGVDTRPLYITKRIDNGSAVISLANRLYASAYLANQGHRRLHGYGSDRYAGAWTAALSVIPATLRQLLATPPYVPSGLWGMPGHLGESTWETATGQPVRWKVISQNSVSLNLLDCWLTLADPSDYARSDMWVTRLNGENLMAARLWQMSYKDNVIERFLHANMMSNGVRATLRDSVTYKVNTESVSERSLWLGLSELID